MLPLGLLPLELAVVSMVNIKEEMNDKFILHYTLDLHTLHITWLIYRQ